MFSGLTNNIPPELIRFLLVILFSFLIGLEQRRNHPNMDYDSLFGTDRTFTLIGILGFILYIIGPQTLVPFLGGGLALSALLTVNYFQKIQQQKKYGLTTVMIALVTYCLAPVLCTQGMWMGLLLVVSTLILAEVKETLGEFSQKVSRDEFITLAKFLTLAGVILPLLPDTAISAELNVSPYRVWLAIVVVSTISYLSYLLKKFVFPDAGILLTGVLGGLYSSTATTVILARKSKEQPVDYRILPAILAATTMMYLRIFLLALFFNHTVAIGLLPSFVIFLLTSAGLSFYFLKSGERNMVASNSNDSSVKSHGNPLEFNTAIVFGLLFIFFAVVTTAVIKYYGQGGVNILAFVVGVTDIDPFIINLFQSKGAIDNGVVIAAALSAIASNNFLKMIYALVLSDKSLRRNIATSFGVLIVLGILLAYVIPLHVWIMKM